MNNKIRKKKTVIQYFKIHKSFNKVKLHHPNYYSDQSINYDLPESLPKTIEENAFL